MHERNRERNSPVSRLDVGWVRQSTPRKLRECLPELEDTLGLHLEPTLLRHGRVPAVSIVISLINVYSQTNYTHVVCNQERTEQQHVTRSREMILGWIM